eukprot:6455881-Amphidinium_carterae.1
METIMTDIQVQLRWPCEDDIVIFSEHTVKEAMNKELAQVIDQQEVFQSRSRSTAERSHQLQHVVATRWVITQRPTNNGAKDIKCRFCGKGFSNDSRVMLVCLTTNNQQSTSWPTSMIYLLLETILQHYHPHNKFQQHLELKHTSQLTKTTPLEFLGKTIELQDDWNNSLVSFST